MSFSGYTDWGVSDKYWGGWKSSSTTTLGRMLARLAWTAEPNADTRKVKFTFRFQMIQVFSQTPGSTSSLDRGNMAYTVNQSANTYIKVNNTNIFGSNTILNCTWPAKSDVGSLSNGVYSIKDNAVIRVDNWNDSKTKEITCESDGSVKLKVDFRIYAPNIYQVTIGSNEDVNIKLTKTITIPSSVTGIGPDWSGPSAANFYISASPTNVKPDETISWERGSLTGGQGNGTYKAYETYIHAVRNGNNIYTSSAYTGASGSFIPKDLYQARPGDTIVLQSLAKSKNSSGTIYTVSSKNSSSISLYKSGLIVAKDNQGTRHEVVSAYIKNSSGNIIKCRYLKTKDNNGSYKIIDVFTTQYE